MAHLEYTTALDWSIIDKIRYSSDEIITIDRREREMLLRCLDELTHNPWPTKREAQLETELAVAQQTLSNTPYNTPWR